MELVSYKELSASSPQTLKNPKRVLQNVCNTRFKAYSNLKDDKAGVVKMFATARFEP